MKKENHEQNDLPQALTIKQNYGYEKVAFFPDRLRQAMNESGLNGAKLARATDLSDGTISRYLLGTVVPRADAVYKLALALNVSEPWLLGYSAPKSREGVPNVIEDAQTREPEEAQTQRARLADGSLLSATEVEMVKSFRLLSLADQVKVLQLVLDLAKEASEK